MDLQPCHDTLKPCYGLSFSQKSRACTACQYAHDCEILTGSRGNAVAIDRVRFTHGKLGVSQLDNICSLSNDDVYQEYRRCFKSVYGTSSDDPELVQNFARKIITACHDLRITMRLFMLTNMHGFLTTNPERRFHAKFLLTTRAKQRVDVYRKEIVRQYGTFDIFAFKKFFDCDDKVELQSYIASSESIAARWIAGFSRSHDDNPYNRFFFFNELRLHPAWLATEPRYLHFIKKYEPRSRAVLEHREEVNILLNDKDYLLGSPANDDRDTAIQKLIPDVLFMVGLDAADITCTATVDDRLAFWKNIGVASQAKLCLRYYVTRDTSVLTPLQIHNVDHK